MLVKHLRKHLQRRCEIILIALEPFDPVIIIKNDIKNYAWNCDEKSIIFRILFYPLF